MILGFGQDTGLVFALWLKNGQFLLTHLGGEADVHPAAIFMDHLVELDASLLDQLAQFVWGVGAMYQ